MENNQDGLKAVLQEKDCVGVPANEEYQEYLAAKKNATRKLKRKTATEERFHIFSQAFCCQFSSYQFLRFLLHTL